MHFEEIINAVLHLFWITESFMHLTVTSQTYHCSLGRDLTAQYCVAYVDA